MTAYDELATFQFKPGKAYDKRSVEEFRASALTALDDALRTTTALEDQLAAGSADRPPFNPSAGHSLSADEQRLIEQFRSMDSNGRLELLQRATNPPEPFRPSIDLDSSNWDGPEGWQTEQTHVVSAAGDPFPGQSFESWDAAENFSLPNPFEISVVDPAPYSLAPIEAPPSYEQPDWLSDWNAISPDPAQAPPSPPAFEWEMPAPAPASFAAPNPLQAMRIPPEFPAWQAAADIPVQAEVVQHSENIAFTDLGLTDERLEALFSQLDFGPPTVGVLPDDHGNIAHHQSSPLRVEQLEADSLPLPPAVRPWEGWIQ